MKALWLLAFALLTSATWADTLFVASSVSGNIAQVTADGKVSTLATGLNHPSELVYSSGNLYVATDNCTINKISDAGLVSVVATQVGANAITRLPAFAPSASSFIGGLTVDAQGNLFALDEAMGLIIKVTPGGVINQQPTPTGRGVIGLVMDQHGNLYYGNPASRGEIVKVAPNGAQSNIAAGQNIPQRLAIDRLGNLFATSTHDDSLRKISPAGVITTFTGVPILSYALAVDAQGNVFIGGTIHNGGPRHGEVYKMTPAGVFSHFATGFSDVSGLAIRPTPSNKNENPLPPSPPSPGLMLTLAAPAVILLTAFILWLFWKEKRKEP